MKIRLWQMPRRPQQEGVESRFPPGTRSGEGSESVRVFVEAARRSRVDAIAPLPATTTTDASVGVGPADAAKPVAAPLVRTHT